jgi:hypothetical protein
MTSDHNWQFWGKPTDTARREWRRLFLNIIHSGNYSVR